MDKNLSIKCEEKILKCKAYKRKSYKAKCRNELYLLMKEDIIKWIKSILRKWYKHETEEEVLSLSWDCFEFCLKHYKINGKNKVEKHFYNYISYYLLNRYGQKESVHLPLDELKDVISIVKTPHNIAFEKLLTLMQFKECIPEKYKLVWDDAIQSLSLYSKERMVTIPLNMDKRVYNAIKKVFIEQIKMILN